jgi:hypothetical protein
MRKAYDDVFHVSRYESPLDSARDYPAPHATARDSDEELQENVLELARRGPAVLTAQQNLLASALRCPRGRRGGRDLPPEHPRGAVAVVAIAQKLVGA